MATDGLGVWSRRNGISLLVPSVSLVKKIERLSLRLRMEEDMLNFEEMEEGIMYHLK